jgi:hypothetical protein
MAALDVLPAWLSFVVFLIAIAIGVLWLLLPLAVFGIKPRLDRAIREAEAVRAELQALREAIQEPGRKPSPSLGSDDLESLPSMRASRTEDASEQEELRRFQGIRQDPRDRASPIGG